MADNIMGNSSGDMANNGYVAYSSDWIYFALSWRDMYSEKLCRIRHDLTDFSVLQEKSECLLNDRRE